MTVALYSTVPPTACFVWFCVWTKPVAWHAVFLRRSTLESIRDFEDICKGLITSLAYDILAHHTCSTLALVDPLTTHHLPRSVVAASGLDVVMHAAESFTARPFSQRTLGEVGAERPLNQVSPSH
jgi:hypothetical protein